MNKIAKLLTLTLFSTCISAAALPAAESSALLSETDAQLAMQLTTSLVVEIGPRLAGSPADRKAVAWAQQHFKALGYDKVWTEEFKTPYWQRGHARLEVLSPFPQSLTLTALGGSVGTPATGLQGQLVVFDSLEALQAAPRDQVQGKMVFINKAMAKDKAGAFYGQVAPVRSQGAIEASKKGAIAILIRSVGTSQNRFAHTGKMSYAEGVPPIPAVAVSVPDALQLLQILKRAPDAQLMLQMQNTTEDAISHNVIAEITGSERPDEIVLISAHLDSWDQGTGALDDGAGVGLVMATGALLKQQGRPKRTIRVVLFGNEEGGLVGARAYAAKHAKDLKSHVLAAESDFGAGLIYQFDSFFGNDALPFADKIQQQLAPLGIAKGHNKAYGGPDISVLKALGVPVVTLEQDGTDYFDYHHTPNDTLDKIDPKALAQNLQAWVMMTRMVANSTLDFRR